jgi:hypothetical protein
MNTFIIIKPNKMKTSFFFLTVMLLLCQMAGAQIKFAMKAGATFSTFKASSTSGTVSDYKTIVGFQGGPMAEISLSNYFSIQPELLFSTKGAITEAEETYPMPSSTGYTEYHIKLKATITPMYIDLPLHLKINLTSLSSGKFSIGMGPLFSYGLGGKAKITGSINDTKLTGEASIFNSEKPILKDENGNDLSGDAEAESMLKRFDIGLSSFASFELKNHFLMILSYQLGLKDISKSSDEKLHNRCFIVSLGYKF